jgi:hypothetical protein
MPERIGLPGPPASTLPVLVADLVFGLPHKEHCSAGGTHLTSDNAVRAAIAALSRSVHNPALQAGTTPAVAKC